MSPVPYLAPPPIQVRGRRLGLLYEPDGESWCLDWSHVDGGTLQLVQWPESSAADIDPKLAACTCVVNAIAVEHDGMPSVDSRDLLHSSLHVLESTEPRTGTLTVDNQPTTISTWILPTGQECGYGHHGPIRFVIGAAPAPLTSIHLSSTGLDRWLHPGGVFSVTLEPGAE